MSLAKKTIPLYNIIAGGRKAEKEEKVVGALTTFFLSTHSVRLRTYKFIF